MKLLISFVFILLFPLFLSGNSIKLIDNIHNDLNKSKTKIELEVLLLLVSNISDTVHYLQQERGASTGFISSNGEKFSVELDKITKQSDLKKQKLLSNLNNNFNLLHRYFSDNELNALNSTFNKINILREDVKNLNIDFPKTYSKYTQMIAILLLNISNISDKVENEKLMNMLYSYSTFLMHKESMGQKRAALSGLFSKQTFSKDIYYEYFLTSDTQEKIYLKVFLNSADSEVKKIVNNPSIGEEKRGDFKGVFVHKFKLRTTQQLLAYRFIDEETLELIKIGPHGNYYRDLKSYLKSK